MKSAPYPLLTETTFHVRFAETDMMGVVHHAMYVVYFEEGRSELSRQRGIPYSALEAMGYSLAVSELQVRYVASARYDDFITVRTWLEALRSRGMTFGYEVINPVTGQVLVTGLSKHICVDRDGQVRRLPEEWIAPFKKAFQEAVRQ